MKFKSLLLSLVLIFTLSGCTNETKMVVLNTEIEGISQVINNNVLGKSALVEIGNELYYDSVTGIVYWWNGYLNDYDRACTTPTPYYSSNGLLYRYIPETNILEEVINENN